MILTKEDILRIIEIIEKKEQDKSEQLYNELAYWSAHMDSEHGDWGDRD